MQSTAVVWLHPEKVLQLSCSSDASFKFTSTWSTSIRKDRSEWNIFCFLWAEIKLELCPKWHYIYTNTTQVTFTSMTVFNHHFYEPWPLFTPITMFRKKPQMINQSLICCKYLIVACKFCLFIHYGLFGVLRGTKPNTVGGLAHWIQTVYGESSSSDDTMWAACSSQNTNVPCESEKKKEKKWVFHRNNLVNKVAARRENTCVLPKFWHGAVSSLPEPYLVECKFNVALTAMTKRTLSQAGNCKVSRK